MLAEHLQVARVRLAALAGLAKTPAPAFVLQMRGKILRVRDGRLLDFLAGGGRLRVFERDADGLDLAALRPPQPSGPTVVGSAVATASDSRCIIAWRIHHIAAV